MQLPVEIRLLIYNELMVHNVDLYRAKCQCCWLREDYDPSKRPEKHTKLHCAQIVRTSKQIYSETLPILYSKNTVHIECLECETSNGARLWPLLDISCKFRTNPVGDYTRHVRKIAIVYVASDDNDAYSSIPKFAIQWPRIESQILANYENTEHISLHISLYIKLRRRLDAHRLGFTFNLVRRICKPSSERVYDYKRVIADWIVKHSDSPSMIALQRTCDAIILSHSQGHLKDTSFAVQSIRWKPRIPQMDGITLYLECDNFRASDTTINEIVAEQMEEDANFSHIRRY